MLLDVLSLCGLSVSCPKAGKERMQIKIIVVIFLILFLMV